MRKLIYPMASLIFLAALGAVKGGDPFAGKWLVTITTEDGKAYPDTLIFLGGKFISEESRTHGFKETSYDTDVRGGQTQTFAASAKSEKQGSTKWTGTTALGEITGTFIWTKADGTTASYTFKGTRTEK